MPTLSHKVTIQDLVHKGLIIPGHQYVPKHLIPKKVPSLAEVRRRLAKIKGNLSDTVAEMREEES